MYNSAPLESWNLVLIYSSQINRRNLAIKLEEKCFWSRTYVSRINAKLTLYDMAIVVQCIALLHLYFPEENGSLLVVWWIKYQWVISLLTIQFTRLQLIAITVRRFQENKLVWLHPRSIIWAIADWMFWYDGYWWLVSIKHLSSSTPSIPLQDWPIENHSNAVLMVKEWNIH